MDLSALGKPKVDVDSVFEGVLAGTKPTPGDKEGKIRKYAQEFEATLLAKLYKDMQHSLSELPGDEDPGADTLTDMGVHALATGIVAGGGIGIANLLIQRLVSKGARSSDTKSQL